MAFTNEEVLTNQLIKVMKQEFDINEREVKFAAHAAWTELIQSKKDIEREGEKTIEWLHKNNRHGIVLDRKTSIMWTLKYIMVFLI